MFGCAGGLFLSFVLSFCFSSIEIKFITHFISLDTTLDKLVNTPAGGPYTQSTTANIGKKGAHCECNAKLS